MRSPRRLLGATKGGQVISEGYIAARNLGRGVRIPDGLSQADEDDARGYTHEERERTSRRRDFFDDCGPFVGNEFMRRW